MKKSSKDIDWPAILRAFRVKHRLSQDAFAKHLKCDKRTVQHWEAGHRTPISFLSLALDGLVIKLTRERKAPHATDKRKR